MFTDPWPKGNWHCDQSSSLNGVVTDRATAIFFTRPDGFDSVAAVYYIIYTYNSLFTLL